MLAFTKINYKIQGAIFISVIVDLKRPNRIVSNTYKRFRSISIKLLHLHSCVGLDFYNLSIYLIL